MKPLYKEIALICVAALFSITLFAQEDCGNVGFEDGTFTGWVGSTGYCCPINPSVGGIVAGRHTVVSGSGFDPIVTSLPVVSPFGGTYSVKLGNANAGAESEKLVLNYTPTVTNRYFNYSFAALFQVANHAGGEEGRFEVVVKTQNGTVVPGTYKYVSTTSNTPNYQTFNGGGYGLIGYVNWSYVSIDLYAYIGQPLTITFQTGDCDLGGHFGYAYIDAECAFPYITSRYCTGSGVAELDAPFGFKKYLWSTGDTTESILVANSLPGDTISVICQAWDTNTPPTILKDTIPQTLIFNSHFFINGSCSTVAVFTDSSLILNSGYGQITHYEWLIDDSLIATQSQISYDFIEIGIYNVSLIVHDNNGCTDTSSKQMVIGEPIAVTPILSHADQYNGYGVSCIDSYDGTAEVSVSHGVQPLTFAWNIDNTPNTAMVNNLPAGLYTVTVSDYNGCQAITSIQLVAPPAIVPIPTIQNVQCFGESTGSIALNASGGAGALTFTWHHDNQLNASTITGLNVGMYMYTITDANSCSVTGTATVQNTVQDALQVAPSGTEILCAGDSNGAIELFADGGAGSYTYHWSHNSNLTASTATQLSAGLYTVTVTDANNCSATATVQLSAPQAITTNPAVLNALCFGSADGSINLHASGGTGSLTTGWSHNSQLNSDLAQNLSAGTYAVTVSDENSCTISTNITITQPADYSVMSVVAAATTFGTCDGSVSLNLTGGTTPYTYNWSTSPAQTTAAVTQLCAGTYTVTITDANNCTTTATYTIEQPLETGISKLSELSGVSLWPNPYKHLLNLTNVPQGSYDIRIVNAQSSLVYSRQNAVPGNDGTIQLNMQAQPAGVYFITLSSPKATITLQAVRQ